MRNVHVFCVLDTAFLGFTVTIIIFRNETFPKIYKEKKCEGMSLQARKGNIKVKNYFAKKKS